MNIFANLPFEFLRKIILFSFDTTKNISKNNNKTQQNYNLKQKRKRKIKIAS